MMISHLSCPDMNAASRFQLLMALALYKCPMCFCINVRLAMMINLFHEILNAVELVLFI